VRPHEEIDVNLLRGIWLIGAATLIACSSSEGDWKKADTAGTIASYQKFLTDHPNDSHAEQARNRVHSLEDEQAWTLAQTSNTLDSFKQYIQTQPNGAHSADARERMTGFERAAAWKTLQASATAPALQEFLQKYPHGSEADQAQAQLQKLNAEQYRVQLGTFRAKEQADRARTKLQSRYGNLLHDIVVVAPTPADKLNRVVSAPMTLDQAKSACTTLSKAKQHCEVVKA
jgi:outer membrane protein assembly factor BamD (BamD/ComL family)